MLENKVTIVKNMNHKADLSYAFALNRWVLYITASWPLTSKHSLTLRIGNKILYYIQCTIMVTFLIPYTWEGVLLEQNFLKKLKQFLILNLLIGYFVKCIIYMIFSDKVRICIDQMTADWVSIFDGSRNIMLKYAKFGRNFTIVSMVFIYSTWIAWQVVAAVKKVVVAHNMTIYNLPYPAYYGFFEPKLSPQFYFIHIFQSVALFLFCCSMCNTCTAVTLIAHVCGQYEILIRIVQNFGASDVVTMRKVDLGLRIVISKHYQLLRFSSNLDMAFRWMFYIEWLTCMMGVCISSYFFVTEQEGLIGFARNFSTLCTLMLMFLMLCYVGNDMTSQSLKLSEAAYMSKWYNLQKKQIFNLHMINSAHRFPKILTAGRIIVLSRETFSDVMKRSMAFFSLLRTLT